MKNPWINAITKNQQILEIDKPFLEAHNYIYRRDPERLIHLDLLPAPYLGFHNAPVVVLLANPGWDPRDYEVLEKPNIFRLELENLNTEGGTPHFCLTEEFINTPGGDWWQKRTSSLAKDVGGYEVLAENLLAVELHGYHSKSWSAPLANFPSQAFGFHLVKKAIERGALIITARCRDYWLAGVPELVNYKNVISRTKSPRAAHLSLNNLGPSAYAKLVKALRG